MTTIYLVSKGSYSDYHIIAAFSTREMAEKVAKQETDRWDETSVEEYELDAPNWKEQLSQVKETDKCWSINLNYDGRTCQEILQVYVDTISGGLNNKAEIYYHDYSNLGKDSPYYHDWWLRTLVIAETEEAATKIATDRFQGFIAKRALDGKPLPRGK